MILVKVKVLIPRIIVQDLRAHGVRSVRVLEIPPRLKAHSEYQAMRSTLRNRLARNLRRDFIPLKVIRVERHMHIDGVNFNDVGMKRFFSVFIRAMRDLKNLRI